jgi:hypothetical protein
MVTIKEKLAPAWADILDASFLLVPLTPYDAIDFRNEITYQKGKLKVSGEGVRIAGNAVRDWRNMANEKGEPVAFSRDAYDNLTPKYVEAVALEVFKRTFLSEIERKN